MTLRLNGSTSGYTEIDAPAVAGSNTLRLPTGNGSDGNILGTDGAGNLSWVNGRMVLETAKATTSGTSIDFTGIPSWVKRITVMLNEVSSNGSSALQVQLGTSSGFSNSGYTCNVGVISYGGGTVLNTATSGFFIPGGDAATIKSGLLQLNLISGNTWLCNGNVLIRSWTYSDFIYGSATLSGTLDRLRLTTVNGTDTFDAGSINILYEG
jgi:hypothetical protein